MPNFRGELTTAAPTREGVGNCLREVESLAKILLPTFGSTHGPTLFRTLRDAFD